MTFWTRTTFVCVGTTASSSSNMEFLLSAVLGDLSTRLVSALIDFFISKSSKLTALEEDLQRALLHAQVISDEAMGRRITNHAMLLQLEKLREAIHRGCYKIDTFRYQSHNEDNSKQVCTDSASPSKVNSVKRHLFSIRAAKNLDELQEVLDNLKAMILDANELVLFLTNYPCLYRQPYSMHLLLNKSIFGRQMETELVMNFLLNTEPHGSEELGILPIVGPNKVGKSTFAAHICNDERVRDHFSDVIFLHDHDVTSDQLATFREGFARKQQYWLPKSKKKGRRLLVVVELSENLNEYALNRLNSVSVPSGGKIIVTSRSDKIINFGTTQALTLKYLSHEAYWYFFKTLAFGGTDPEMHPRLVYVAMEIARLLDGNLLSANITAKILRDNFDIRFWCKVLALTRSLIQRHVSRSGEHPFNMDQMKPLSFRRRGASSKDFVIDHQYLQRPLEEEVPDIGIQDVLYGSIKPQGKFEYLVWKSQIPPYHIFVNTCEIRELKTVGVKRTRSMKTQATLC